MDYTKDELLRALITSICKTEEYPDIRYPKDFIGQKYLALFEKLAERKNDLPSLEFIADRYSFNTFETNLKLTDIQEKLDSILLEEQVKQVIKTYQQIKDTKNILDIVNDLTSDLKKVASITGGASTINLSKEADKAVESYVKDLQEVGPPIKTGFVKLDEIAPIRRGNLVLLIGGTKQGKSVVLNRMFCTNLQEKAWASMWSLELPIYQVVNRMLAGLGEFPYGLLSTGKVSRGEYLNAIKKHNTAFISTRQNVKGKINADTLERHIETIKGDGIDLYALYLDYHTLFDINPSWDAQESFTGRLKQIALQHNVAIILAAQADTEAVKSGEMPHLYSTKKNKSIADDCDMVIGMVGQQVAGGRRRKIDIEVLARRDGGLPKFSYLVDLNNGVWELQGDDWSLTDDLIISQESE